MLISVCCVRHLEYNAKRMRVLPTRPVSCTDSEPTSKTRGNTLLVLLLRNVSYRDNCIGIRIVSWKNVSLQAHVPSGFARDAVSIPREFDNEFAYFKSENKTRKSFKNESLIHSHYFGLNRIAIAAIEIATITELRTFFS